MRVLIALTAFLATIGVAQAHGLFIFPNEGQDQEQQDMDEFQCIRIARDQTGFDPMATPTATEARPETRGGAVGGAAGGALLGAAVGAVGGGGARRGATVGAVGGGLLGGMVRNDSRRQQDQWAQEQAATYRADRDRWTRAFTACMQSRGYTIG